MMFQTDNPHTQIVELTKELILFQSTAQKPHHLQNVVDFCENYLSENGFTISKYMQNDKPSLVASTHDTKEFDVLLAGHLDVIEAEQREFVPRIQGDKLYGRGAADMKGSVAASILAFQKVHKTRPELKLGLMLTSDEEVGGQNGAQYLVEQGYKAKLVIVPDGGAMDAIITSQKGLIFFKATLHGTAAHGSRPWLGDNAINKVCLLYKDLQKQFPKPESEDDWRPSVNIGKIQAGNAINQVPDKCEAYFDVRLTEKHSFDEWYEIIKKVVKDHDADFEIQAQGDICFTDFNDEYLQQYKSVAEGILGREVNFGVEAGGSDARFFSSAEMPVLITRPDGADWHNNGEWVSIESLQTFYDILLKYLEQIEV
ncbi:MAG: M20 family metallopeptidase [Patescibacteria group bacterium]